MYPNSFGASIKILLLFASPLIYAFYFKWESKLTLFFLYKLHTFGGSWTRMHRYEYGIKYNTGTGTGIQYFLRTYWVSGNTGTGIGYGYVGQMEYPWLEPTPSRSTLFLQTDEVSFQLKLIGASTKILLFFYK